MKHIVSFSGGKDSTAMLLMMLEKNMPVGEIVFCDTTVEFPNMYEHIQKVEKYIGRPIRRIAAKNTFEFMMLEYEKTKGKSKGELGYGWPKMISRWCTKYFKQQPMGKLYKNDYQYIGIAADERHRVKEGNFKYPLVEWGITEKQALQYCYDKGFNWDGLYEYFDRVSCWLCPMQSLKELKNLYQHFPELWIKLKELDAKTPSKFRFDYTFPELEERFNRQIWFEENQITMFGG